MGRVELGDRVLYPVKTIHSMYNVYVGTINIFLSFDEQDACQSWKLVTDPYSNMRGAAGGKSGARETK